MTQELCERDDDYWDEESAYDLQLQRYIGTAALTIGLANKQYGGPEEGGWWYDTFHPRRVFYVPSGSKIHHERKLERWCERMNKAEGRYPPGSVLCRGWWTVIRDAITTDQPEGRQYYS